MHLLSFPIGFKYFFYFISMIKVYLREYCIKVVVDLLFVLYVKYRIFVSDVISKSHLRKIYKFMW